jgi:hypothetical protein
MRKQISIINNELEVIEVNDEIILLARELIEWSDYYKELEAEYTDEVIFEKAMEEATEYINNHKESK